MKYLVSETVACYVTWTRTIEAASELEAKEAFYDGEGETAESEALIGDSIPFLPAKLEVIPILSIGG